MRLISVTCSYDRLQVAGYEGGGRFTGLVGRISSGETASAKIDLDASGRLRAFVQISLPYPLPVLRCKRRRGHVRLYRVYPARLESPVRPWNQRPAVWESSKTVPPVQSCPGKMHHAGPLSATPQPTPSARISAGDYAGLCVGVRLLLLRSHVPVVYKKQFAPG